MKVSIATLALVAQADDRKVPPRHPVNRIKKLGVFMDNFADEMVSMGKMKQGQADRFSSRMDGFLHRMQTSFERENCGYYSGSGKHGGPDPNPELRPNGKARNRRDIDEEDLHEAAHEWCAAELAEAYVNDDGEFNAANYAECCGFSDDYCIAGVQAPRSGKKSAYDRLSNNPELKWKQITTGVRKWAQRYINNCHGQRTKSLASKRANRLYKAWDERLFN